MDFHRDPDTFGEKTIGRCRVLRNGGSFMALRPIARPIDRIAVSILGNVTLAKIQHLQDSIATKSRRNIRNLTGRTGAPGGHNLVSLDIASLDTASRRGTRDIQVRLDVGFSTGSINKAKVANQLCSNQMEQIDSLLGALRRIEVAGDVECEAVFVFDKNETMPRQKLLLTRQAEKVSVFPTNFAACLSCTQLNLQAQGRIRMIKEHFQGQYAVSSREIVEIDYFHSS